MAQEKKWPITYPHPSIYSAPVVGGYIVTKNADTLRGLIKLWREGIAYPVWDTITNVVKDVAREDIKSMRIFSNSPTGTFTDYVNLNYKRTLWRVIAEKKGTAICDDPLHLGMNIMLLVKPHEILKMYGSWALFTHGGKDDELLLRFINRRYRTKFEAGHFKDSDEALNYILDRETEP
ncbi:hypothetical protein GCM10011511_32440 [Puia dinghuensis]|uniref:Uncharacterized protein n=1 Tax=Puia dinghuensis TaxID=1792502 RepID=A0A8J2UEH4_9BACT|nr:hypothetical protein GCM10011511_32440 [Puia dinghuensis]